MSQLTVFLARLVGLLAVLLAAFVLMRGDAAVKAIVADNAAMFVLALVSLAAGLAMIIGHNIWSGGALPVVVTLVGWLIFLKGLLLLLPGALAPMFDRLQYDGVSYFILVPALVLGVYLTWAGFTARLPHAP
jgi:hypothetical protein